MEDPEKNATGDIQTWHMWVPIHGDTTSVSCTSNELLQSVCMTSSRKNKKFHLSIENLYFEKLHGQKYLNTVTVVVLTDMNFIPISLRLASNQRELERQLLSIQIQNKTSLIPI